MIPPAPPHHSHAARRVALAVLALTLALLAAGAVGAAGPPPVALAGPRDAAPAAPAAPEQTAWQRVPLAGATCARGEPYAYFLNPATDPEAGVLILLNGGGACLKEGRAPAGAGGAARQLHCMDYTNFTDTTASVGAMGLVGQAIRFFRRADPANPFRAHNLVWLPYCTGDVFTGRMTAPYDYDPDPMATFDVVHRGGLNVLAALDDLATRFPARVPVVLGGLSAGGFGAIFNFPEVVGRWPHTVLLPDAGIAPPNEASLLRREGARVAARWGARAVLPAYCRTDDCLADTLRLLAAHARHHDGREAPWLPFGYLQGQQDATLSSYLEISTCGYEMGLRRAYLDSAGTPNLRAYLPATDQHVFTFSTSAEPYRTPIGGVELLGWVSRVAAAASIADLPPDAADPWLGCNAVYLPAGFTPPS